MEKVRRKKRIDYFRNVFSEKYLNRFTSKEDKVKFIADEFEKLNRYLTYCVNRDKFDIVTELIKLQDFITNYLKEM